MPTWPDLARHHLAFFFDPDSSVQGWRVWRALPIDPAGVGQGVDLAAAMRAGAEVMLDNDGGVEEVLIRRAPDLPNPGESVLSDIFPGAVFRDRSLLQQSIRLDRRPDGPVAHYLWQADPAGRDPTVIRGRPRDDDGLDLSLLALTEESASAYGGTPQLLSGGVWHLLQREPGAGGWWALPAASWIGLDAGRQHALRHESVTIPAPDPAPSETPMSPPSIDQAPDADDDLDEDVPEPTPTSAGKRADFGEHIGGSRKDLAGQSVDRALALRIETLTQLGTLSGRQDALSQSLAGKHLRGLRRDVLWPAPSAATLNARRTEGADPWALLFAEWMRQTTRRHAAEGMRLKYANTEHLERVALGHVAAMTLVQERLAGVRTPSDLLALCRAPYTYGRVEPRLQHLLRQHQGSAFEDLMAGLREQVPPSETLSFWNEVLRTQGRGWPRATTRALQISAPEHWLADRIESARAPAQDGIDALRAVFDAHKDQVRAQHRDILADYDVPRMRAAWAPCLDDLRHLPPAEAMLAARDHQMLQILYLEHLMQGPVLADWMEGMPLQARDPSDRGGHYQIRADPEGEHYWHLNDHLRLRFLLGAGGDWLGADPARQQRIWTQLHDLLGLETAPDGLAVASLPRKAKSKASASPAADALDADDINDADEAAPADQDADAAAENEQAPARVIWSQKTPAPRYEHLVREGPRRRPVMPGFDPADPSAPARNVTEAEFCEAFGIRAVEYGNWATQRERQDMLDMCYDSLADMAEALDLPYRAMGFDGDLAVAIGARGQGGQAAGHYEPSRRVINFTKTKGTGVLAHEWSHALDYWLGRQFGSRLALSTQVDLNPPAEGETPNASQAMTVFMKTSKSRDHLLSFMTTGEPMARRSAINDAARAEVCDAVTQHRFRAAMQMLARPKLRSDWEQALDRRGRYPGHDEPIDPALVPRDWMRHARDIAMRLAQDGLSAAFKLDIRTWQYSGRMFTQTISAALAESRAKQPQPDTAEAAALRDKLREVADATLSGEIGYKGARALLWRKFRQIDDVFHQHGAQTLFALNAQMLDAGRSPYWSTDVELFARAFSAVIHDRLAGIGVRNDFASAFSAPDAFGGHAFVGNPNPEGLEREGMGRLAEPLLGAVQTLTAGMHPEPSEDRRARSFLKMA